MASMRRTCFGVGYHRRLTQLRGIQVAPRNLNRSHTAPTADRASAWTCIQKTLESPGQRPGRWCAERLIVVPGIATCAWINESPLLAEQLANLIAMDRQDFVPEIVDQFEHGEGDLRWP